MRVEHITDAVMEAITKKIFEEWKHEGGIFGNSNRHINFEVDGKEYLLVVRDVGDKEDWTDVLDAMFTSVKESGDTNESTHSGGK